jgi:hypothetical protein
MDKAVVVPSEYPLIQLVKEKVELTKCDGCRRIKWR